MVAVCGECSGIVVYGGWDSVFGAKRSNQWMHWMQYTAHTPPYTIIPLHTASIASTGLTFMHQRQCLHHHMALFHCVLHTASTALTFFVSKTMSPPPYTTIPLHTASTAYCIHCMPYMAYVGNLFALTKHPRYPPMLLITHESITNQKLFISNQYLMSPPPTKKVPKSYTFLAAWPI